MINEMDYKVIRSARKTIALEIRPDGEVVVRCPNRMPIREVEAFVKSKHSWLERHLSKFACSQVLPPFCQEEIQEFVAQARKLVPERVAYYAQQLGVGYGKIAIRIQRSRWGSCSSKGNLNFNCLLMLAPPEVLDYVIVHELCHRKYLNHSREFWTEVGRILPDYRSQKKWLKENSVSFISRLP